MSDNYCVWEFVRGSGWMKIEDCMTNGKADPSRCPGPPAIHVGVPKTAVKILFRSIDGVEIPKQFGLLLILDRKDRIIFSQLFTGSTKSRGAKKIQESLPGMDESQVRPR
jgi:hypothetical protein